MISVIVYGRNDSYGYNLPKRAALSINCIAHVLDHPDDEIIFVDCNTPNDIPTFPESIADTLTLRAKQLLRILRVRPEQYVRGKNGSKFKVLEPLCRNIAIRRSNPANRWILNTNTDMVFTPLQTEASLSQLVADLPDGFYELPRFEMPESLWESTNRMNPSETINLFRQWGLRFHINEVISAGKEILFDGPGDFQLCLRSQLIDIHGMNEQMVLGWHVDSNLCKRMWLLNGETRTILDRMYAFHCDHTRIQTVYHVAGKSTANSIDDFFTNVKTPYVPEQANCWGMPGEPVEEFRLLDSYTKRMAIALEGILPGMQQPLSHISIAGNAFDASLYYDDQHVFPYLADIIVNSSPPSNVGYFGNNLAMLQMLADFRKGLGHLGVISYMEDLLLLEGTNRNLHVPETCCPLNEEDIYCTCETFVFDFGMKNFPSRINCDGFRVPERCRMVGEFARMISHTIKHYAEREQQALQKGLLLRPFIFVGCHNTWFDQYVQSLFGCALTPTSTYVRHGFLRPDAFEADQPIMALHTYIIGEQVEEFVGWISARIGKPISVREFITADVLYKMFTTEKDKKKALDAFETLINLEAGQGLLALEIEIAEINGVPELAEGLRRFIADYQKRPYRNG
jgi:hypothetical protein